MAPKRQAGSNANSSSPATPSSGGKSTSASVGASQTTSSRPTGSSTASPSTGRPSKSTKPSPKSASEIVNTILNNYVTTTPQRVKLIDAFMGFLVALGVVQFVYVVLAGNYPFNAFLSGFSATVGQFVLTASLRMQTNPENKQGNFEGISDERAFADFVFGSLILHLFCVNFIN